MPDHNAVATIPLPRISRRRTLAIFSVSAGAGHVRAAEALAKTASMISPQLNVIHVDVMSLVTPLFKKVYADSYTPLVEHHPGLWGYLYAKADRRKVDSALDRFRAELERLNTQKLKDLLEKERPDVILCTHFLPAELLGRWRRRKKFSMPVWVVVTDFDVHMLWVHKYLTGYFTAGEEVAWRLHDRGVAREDIHVTGIPIMPVFGTRLSREECSRELGLDPRKPTVLLLAGSAGIVGIQKLPRRLLDLSESLQIIAVAGRNKRMLAALQEAAATAPHRMKAIGFTTTIERQMAASDLAITKPGGLTTSECLAAGLPMLIVSPIPGQEERNADYLLEQGVALKAYDDAGVEFRVRSLLAEPERIARMKEHVLRIAKPNAARDILNTVLR